MMRYLITGAQGFAGRFLCAEILHSNPTAIIVGTGRSSERRATFTHEVSWGQRRVVAPVPAQLGAYDRERYQYLPCDLSAGEPLDELAAVAAPDVVVHLAAALRDDPADRLIRSNVGGTVALIGALAKLPRKPLLVLGSSGSIYGVPQSLPLREDQRCAPHEPYAMSKHAAELAARVLTDAAGIPMMIARIFNIAGPGQDERHVCGRFAAQAAAIVRGDSPPALEVGDLRPTRDFIDVRDVARALIALVTNGTPGETYNIASGLETAIAEILRLTLRAARVDHRVEIIERYARAGDVSRAFADIEKLRGCGYRPAFSIEATIADVLDYYLVDVARGAMSGATISAVSSLVTGMQSSQG